MDTRKTNHPYAGWVLMGLILLALLFLLAACGKKNTPTPALQPIPANDLSNSGLPISGQADTGSGFPDGTLMAFFPLSGSGFNVELTQDKAGFADAALKFESTEVARLSIRDAAADPASLASFQNSAAQIATYPTLELSDGATAILVANRFVVGVKSVVTDFSAADRKYWLEQFDLGGLAQLK